MLLELRSHDGDLGESLRRRQKAQLGRGVLEQGFKPQLIVNESVRCSAIGLRLNLLPSYGYFTELPIYLTYLYFRQIYSVIVELIIIL